MQVELEDGLYRVVTAYLCAGFSVRDGQVVDCAPILRRKLGYWVKIAERVPETNEEEIGNS